MYDFKEEFRKEVEGLFNTEFTLQHPEIPIRWRGIPWKQPEDSMWVEFTNKSNPEEQKSLGRNFIVRTTGFLQIDVLIPAEQPITRAEKVAAFAASIFAYRKFKGPNIKITFYEQHITEAPSSGEFARVMARIFYHYDGERIREGVQDLA